MTNDLLWFTLGCLIGFFFGRLTCMLREVKLELDEVDAIVKTDHEHKINDEGGFLSLSKLTFSGVALCLVVFITAFAAFSSQQASDNAKEALDNQKAAQDRLELVVDCSTTFLATTLDALHERTTFATDATKKNIELQTSFSNLLAILRHKPPPSPRQGESATDAYVNDLHAFLVLSTKQLNKIEANPYPTIQAFSNCLDTATSKENK